MPGVLTRSFLEEVVRSSGWSLAEVERLSLEGEGISSLQGDGPFEGARRLVYLDLSRNHLSSLQGIEHLTSLATLILRDNRVESVDEVGRLARLSNLRKLDLRLNPVMSTAKTSSSHNHIFGGSGQSRNSTGGGESGDSSRSGSSRKSRAGIVAMVPQLETLNGRRVLDEERVSHISQQRWQEDSGKAEDEPRQSQWQRPQQRQERQPVHQGQQQRERHPYPRGRQHQLQHQHHYQHQYPTEHLRRERHPLRPDSAAAAPQTRNANNAGVRQAVEDDGNLRAPSRRRESDDFQARDGGRDGNIAGRRPEGPTASQSNRQMREPSSAASSGLRNGEEAAAGKGSSGFLSARSLASATGTSNSSSDGFARGERRVECAVHVDRNRSARVQRSCATSPTRRDGNRREPTSYIGVGGDHGTRMRDSDVVHDDRFVQHRRDARVADTEADTETAASAGDSASHLRAAFVVGGASHRHGSRGFEDVTDAATTSRSRGSKEAASKSSPPPSRECADVEAPYGGSSKGSMESQHGAPQDSPAATEHIHLGAGGRGPKATPPPMPSQDARPDASSPSVAGAVAATTSTRALRAPVRGSGDGGVIEDGDGADGDLAALWRELQGVDESLCSSDSGSRRQQPLTLSSLSSASHASNSVSTAAAAAAAAAASPTSAARAATQKASRTSKPESSGAARAVEAFRRSSQRLGLLPASAQAVGNGDGDDDNDLDARGGKDISADHGGDVRVHPGGDDPSPTAETTAVPVRASARQISGRFNWSPGDAGSGSAGVDSGGAGGGIGGSDEGRRYRRRVYGDPNATTVQVQSPPEALPAAAAVVERALSPAGVETDASDAHSDSPVTTLARTLGPVSSGLAATADAPTLPVISDPSSDVPLTGTTTTTLAEKSTALHASGPCREGLLGERCLAGAGVWDETPVAATAGVRGSDTRKSAEEERWHAREKEFAARWAAREREFEERWAVREREIEQRRREDSSQAFTTEMRSMLLGAHEALISSNAWLVERLKTLEGEAASARHATPEAGASKMDPESTTAPTANPISTNPIPTNINSSSQRALASSSHAQPTAAGESVVSRSLTPGCRNGTDDVDGTDRGTPPRGRSGRSACAGTAGSAGRATEDFSSSVSSSRTSGPVCCTVGANNGALDGAVYDRCSSVTVGTVSSVVVSGRSRCQEGKGVSDRDPLVLPRSPAAAAVASDVRAAMAGCEELLQSQRGRTGGSTPCRVNGSGVTQVRLAGQGTPASAQPFAPFNQALNKSSAVAIAGATDAPAPPPTASMLSREPCVEGSRASGVFPSSRAAVSAASSSPVEVAAILSRGAALPGGGSDPTTGVDEGMQGEGCAVGGPAALSATMVVASPRCDDRGGGFGVDPEVTVSAAPSH